MLLDRDDFGRGRYAGWLPRDRGKLHMHPAEGPAYAGVTPRPQPPTRVTDP